MSKGMDRKKETKKKPLKSPAEKRSEKKGKDHEFSLTGEKKPKDRA